MKYEILKTYRFNTNIFAGKIFQKKDPETNRKPQQYIKQEGSSVKILCNFLKQTETVKLPSITI